MIFVTIIDAQGVEQSRSEVTTEILKDILEAAARVTCEVWSRDHPEDGWEVKIIEEEA